MACFARWSFGWGVLGGGENGIFPRVVSIIRGGNFASVEFRFFLLRRGSFLDGDIVRFSYFVFSMREKFYWHSFRFVYSGISISCGGIIGKAIYVCIHFWILLLFRWQE